MPKASPLKSNFNTGELSPLLYGRPDIDQYKNAMRHCENLIPLVQGGVTRRPGTKFAGTPKFGTTRKCRLVRFEFSVTQAYVIEFGHLYCRFYRNNAIITNTAQNITAISQTNPAVLTYAGADTYANGDRVVVSGVLGMTQVNNREFTVANVNVGANTFELSGVDATGYDAYTSGGTVAEPYEIVTTYDEANLFQLKFSQSADVLYITHPTYAPRKLTRSAHTTWTLTTIGFLDGPYLATNATATTLTPSSFAVGTGVTLTASAVTGINDGLGFQTTDVGRQIRLQQGTVWGYVVITGWTSTTVVTVDIIKTLTSTAAKTNWRMGVWSGTTGYPAAVTFYQDRLFFGGCSAYPQRLDGSRTGDYENFEPSNPADGVVTDSHAVAFTLNANDVNVIRWLAANEKGLAVGTVGGEWSVKPADSSGALSPTNISAVQSSTYGSADVQPIQSGKAVLFVNRTGRKVRELVYVYEVDGFRAPDMTVLAEHVTRGGVTELAYAKDPQSIVWGVRADGQLLGLTYEREQSVVGWHRHRLGGAYSSGDAVVESVTAIPASDGSRDETWMVVKRTVNGATFRSIEYLTKLWERGDAQEDAFNYDCGLTYDSTATTSITGLYYLEGQSVSVMADGAAHPNKTVTNGKITLDREASVVQIGLGYNSDGGLLRFEAGAADGTAQGKTQRMHRVVFRVHDALGLSCGPDFDNLDPVIVRTTDDDMGAMVPLASGDEEIAWSGDYSTEALVNFRFSGGFPGTILAVMPQVVTQDRG